MEQHVAKKKGPAKASRAEERAMLRAFYKNKTEDLLAQIRANFIKENLKPGPLIQILEEESAKAKDKSRRKKDPALEHRARQVKAAVRARRDNGL